MRKGEKMYSNAETDIDGVDDPDLYGVEHLNNRQRSQIMREIQNSLGKPRENRKIPESEPFKKTEKKKNKKQFRTSDE